MRIALPIAGAAAVMLLLGGCVTHPPEVTSVPEPSATPVFATDEDALAAAEAAYGAYVTIADQIFMEGGANPDRLASVATGEFLEAAIDGFEQTQAQGLHSTGGTKFRDMALQSYSSTGGPIGIVVTYVCEDIAAVDVLDAQGMSVVSPTRPATTTFQATFDLVPGSSSLLLSGREVWSNGAC